VELSPEKRLLNFDKNELNIETPKILFTKPQKITLKAPRA